MPPRTRIAAWALVGLFLTACDQEQQPVGPGPPEPPTGLQLSATVIPERLSLGETVSIVFEVTNYGPDPVELAFACRDEFGYRVEDSNRSLLRGSPAFCLAQPHAVSLEPGAMRTKEFLLNGSLAPGRYLVSTGIVGYEAEYPWATTEFVVLYPPD